VDGPPGLLRGGAGVGFPPRGAFWRTAVGWAHAATPPPLQKGASLDEEKRECVNEPHWPPRSTAVHYQQQLRQWSRRRRAVRQCGGGGFKLAAASAVAAEAAVERKEVCIRRVRPLLSELQVPEWQELAAGSGPAEAEKDVGEHRYSLVLQAQEVM
jgi:hypothetical protein